MQGAPPTRITDSSTAVAAVPAASPSAAADACDTPATTPVSIITGFLGAGKTTLLRHVLTAQHGLRIAVIQNELSAVAGLEAATVRGANGEEFEEWLELPNGCLCCAVRDELPVAIERLMEVRGRLDYVLIETTGMADPGPVATSLWLDSELESPIELDGIITVVDAHHVLQQLESLEACRQIGSADVLLLNKIDGCSERHLAKVSATLKQLNAMAPIISTRHSAAPLDKLLHLNAYAAHGGRLLQLDLPTPTVPPTAATASAHRPAFARLCECCVAQQQADATQPASKPERTPVGVGADADAEGNAGVEGVDACAVCEAPIADSGGARWLHLDGDFGAVNLSEAAALDETRLRLWFGRLFWGEEEAEVQPAPQVFRAKGTLLLAGEEEVMYALQAVHDTYELARGPAWPEGERRCSRMVVIGRNLRRVHLEEELRRCVARDDLGRLECANGEDTASPLVPT